MSRLIVVSNRVPRLQSNANAGGLAVAIRSALEQRGGLWFGWSGHIRTQRSARPLLHEADGFSLATLNLTRADYEGYYKGFSNRLLWPLFHNRLRLCGFETGAGPSYRDVNRYFARQVAKYLRSGDTVWVHDYHLIPLGESLRNLGVEAPIGFFLHIPFPPLETILALPEHRDIMRMLLSYDLIGVQTQRDLINLHDYVEQELGGVVHADGRITAFDRTVRAGAFPISIDVRAFAEAAVSKPARTAASKLRVSRGTLSWIVGVDRLDYTKGLDNKFRAYERLLDQRENLRGRVQLIQIAALSREDLPTYANMRAQLDSAVGEITGRFGMLEWTPIRYINKAYSQSHLAALYRCSRVGLVTPLRDGMNLVAKEYVAAQDPDDPGVLVLSKFAGAAEELQEAILVNPYDISGVADAIERALDMPLEERGQRWRRMMDHLLEHDVHRWCDDFLQMLSPRDNELPTRAA